MITLVNSGCKCPMVGKAIAFKTRSGTLDGPGPNKVFSGMLMGVFKISGALTDKDILLI